MNEKMLDAYKALHLQILQLHIRWAQFRFLFTVSDQRMRVLSRTAPGFFAIVRDVFRDDAFISLSRLTDKSTTSGRGNLTIVTLIEIAEKSGEINLAKSTRLLLIQLLECVEAIRIWRNKLLAHLDFEQAVLEVPLPGVKVSRGDVDKALHILRELIHLFADYLSQPPFDYDQRVLVGDADALAQLLENM